MTKIKEYNETLNVTPIWVNDFNEEKAQTFCKDVLKAAESPSIPILIYIDSYGGYVDSLSSMLSTLDSVSNTIITVAIGKAMSCGAVLLSHGDIRFVTPHTRVMVHETFSGAIGNINDIINKTKENQRLNDYFMSILAKNCGKTLKQLKTALPTERRDRYMDAKESVKFGIADHIGTPKLKKVVTLELEVAK